MNEATMHIQCRAAEAGDLPVLNGIAWAAKAHWGYPKEWMEEWRDSLMLTEDDLARWGLRVAVDSDGEVLGFCATSPARPRWVVEHLWVRPGELGRGVGRRLVRDALERAREGGAEGLEIESDPYAEGFYHRLGARTVGSVPAPMPGAPDRTLPLLHWIPPALDRPVRGSEHPRRPSALDRHPPDPHPPRMTLSPTRETTILGSLTAIVAVLGLAGALSGTSSWLEAASVVTGAVCVWLTVRENVWNFPIGLVNVACFSVLFFGSRLYADAGLQVVYFVLGLIGWRLWLRGGERGTALRVSRVSAGHLQSLVVGGVALTLVLWATLRLAGGSASFLDALTTSISLCAQWLLNRKQVESWYFWIVADLIYVPLYLYKELYLTAGLYTVFLVMAIMGLLRWTATWRAQGEAPRAAQGGETPRPAQGVETPRPGPGRVPS